MCLGLVAGNATPALAERVGRLSGQHTQQEMLDLLRRDHQVSWSVAVLRKVSAAVSTGIAPYLRAAQQQALLGWLTQAQQSRAVTARPWLSVATASWCRYATKRPARRRPWPLSACTTGAAGAW